MEHDTASPEAMAELENFQVMPDIIDGLNALTAEIQEDSHLKNIEAAHVLTNDMEVDTIKRHIPPKMREAALHFEKVMADAEASLKSGHLGTEVFKEVRAEATKVRDVALHMTFISMPGKPSTMSLCGAMSGPPRSG